jgi:hypothetical protein
MATTVRVEWSAAHPAALSPLGEPRYPLDRRLGGPQSRSGQHEDVKILCATGIRIQTPRLSSL